MKSVVVVMVVAGAFSVASAATYEWVDKAGVVHFTDDPEKVPADYRGKAIRRESIEENRIGTLPVREGTEQAAPTEESHGAILYGNHDEAWWRNRYATLDRELTQLKNGLPAKNDEMTQLHRRWITTMYASTRAAYYDKKAEIERDEARIAELEQEVQQLKDDANRFGVPVPWRR